MSDEFVHLHCHSEYSLLDGMGRIRDLVQAAAGENMPAVALTDHGTMFGAIEFYGKAKEMGVKPIVGCEVYVADHSIDEKPSAGSRNHHLMLLAENEVGYRNLIQLTTQAHLRGFYRKPRVDHALLEQHSEGLICLSGCASSELPNLILDGDLPAAEEKADWFAQVFRDRYYLELQYHDIDFQKTINQGIVHLSGKLGLPMVATNDVHYVQRQHAKTHEVLLCIQTQTTMSDPKRMRFSSEEFYLKSAAEMKALFADYPGAIANTLTIAERCNLELAFGRPQVPRFETPDGASSEDCLRRLCEEGLACRYSAPTQEIRDRLEYELSVIVGTGFVDYFLLVHDVIHFARTQGIGVGPGRGSSAASLVAYCLFITNVDPIAQELYFERFLNPERVTMPDMDLDFADDRRDEVIRYVTEKYGRDRVAQIITFGTMGPRAGVRDVGRALGMSYPDTDRVAKLIPWMCNKISTAKEEVPELQRLYDGDPAMRNLLDTVENLEGVARHASTHAAGVVISRDPLSEHVPLYKVPKQDQVVTQYAMNSIEKIGLLKMDFLGLRTLTILQKSCALIGEATGRDLKPDDIPLDHESIYELLRSGKTFGVFQVDGAGMRRLLTDLRPTEFKHIVAVVALYRPGPMDYIGEFAARKNGLKEVHYDHPALQEVLEETYGIVVYQDQVMRLAGLIAGYSMGEADLLRRAMGKKKPEELAKHREAFIKRAQALGTDPETAQHLFDIIEPFAGYAFAKAHAAAYAMITCQTAYLKANHPREYMASLMSAERENADRMAEALNDCRQLGVAVLAPDINHSELDFSLEDAGIRFGLAAIKHLGTAAGESIVATRRESGPFTSVEDLCARVDWGVVSKRALESLIRCGAMDCLGVERGRLLASIDRLVSFGTQLHRAAAVGQGSLFGASEQPQAALHMAVAEDATLDEKLEWERELLGFYVSPHPLASLPEKTAELQLAPLASLAAEQNGQVVGAAGMIQNLRSFSTKDGRPMASFRLMDMESTIEVVVFSRAYERLEAKLKDGSLVVVDGKIDGSDGKLRFLADTVWTLDEVHNRKPPNGKANGNGRSGGQSGTDARNALQDHVSNAIGTHRVTVVVQRGDDRPHDVALVEAVYTALQRYQGNDEAEILVRSGSRTESVPLPNRRVRWCEELESELRKLIGPQDVRIDPLRAAG